MTVKEAAREMRANGTPMPEVAAKCGVSLAYAYKVAGDVTRRVVNSASIVTRYLPRNGGCSTTSGMVPISMPRISVLHGAA